MVQSVGGDVAGPGRAAALVADHAHLVAAAADREHGAHEVPPVRGEDPGGAQDGVVGVGGRDQPLAAELARAVGVERAGVVVLAPGAAGGAVEDVVGGDVQERQPARGGGGGHGGGGGGVDRLGQRRLVLGAVDLGVGGGVEDDVDVGGAHRAGAGLGVGEVGRGAPEEARLDAARRGDARQLAGHLPGLAEDERPHQPVRPPSVLEGRHPVAEGGLAAVLVRQDDRRGGQAPVDAEVGVAPETPPSLAAS